MRTSPLTKFHHTGWPGLATALFLSLALTACAQTDEAGAPSEPAAVGTAPQSITPVVETASGGAASTAGTASPTSTNEPELPETADAGGSSDSAADAGMSTEFPGRVVLFNGIDLSNWLVSVPGRGLEGTTPQDQFFQVTSLDGEPVIHVYKDTPADTLHAGFATLVTQAQYTTYRLHVEYKWGLARFKPLEELTNPRRDAGVLYHILDPVDFHATGVPHSNECQLMEGFVGCGNCDSLTGDYYGLGVTGRSYVEDGHYLPQAEGGVEGPAARALSGVFDHLDDWNTLELVIDGTARGDYFLNRQLVNQVFKTSVGTGHIGLQARAAELYYKNIWLDPIDAETPVQ